MKQGETYFSLGITQMTLGNVDGAIELFRKALSFNPNSAVIHAHLAIALSQKGRKDAALHESDIALQLAPASAAIRVAAGIIAKEARQYQAAERHFLSAKQFDPSEPEAYVRLAALYRATERHSLAVAELRRALAFDPCHVDALAILAMALAEQRQLSEARATAREALRLKPEGILSHVAQAYVELFSHNLEAAHDHALLALRSDPSNSDALTILLKVKGLRHPFLTHCIRLVLWTFSWEDIRFLQIIIGSQVLIVLVNLGLDVMHLSMTEYILRKMLVWVLFALALYVFGVRAWFRRSLRQQIAEVKLQQQF